MPELVIGQPDDKLRKAQRGETVVIRLRLRAVLARGQAP
jgi:hypothetical protein